MPSQVEIYLDACERQMITPNSALKMQLEESDAPAQQSYNLSSNMLGDRGALPFLEAVDLDTSFSEISLRGNNLRNKACCALAEMLKRHPHVSKVDLRDNVISATGAQALLELVSSNQGLKEIHIDNNRIPAPLVLKIQAAVGGFDSLYAFAEEEAAGGE